MIVEYLLRGDAIRNFGGDVVQAQVYARELAALGVYVHVTSGPFAQNPNSELLHVFNIDRPVEFLLAVKDAERRGVPYVVSPLHHRRSHVNNFYASRPGVLGQVERHVPRAVVDSTKHVVRYHTSAKLLRAAVRVPATDKRVARALSGAAVVVCLAPGERAWIEEDFGVELSNAVILPNGVSSAMPHEELNRGNRDIDVLVVGRIERRKNQVAIAESLRASSFRTIFVGRGNFSEPKYVEKLISLVKESSNMEWIGAVAHDEMKHWYRRTRVAISASMFEVLSLADLEAAYYGCSVIASRCGNTEYLLEDLAVYCDPYMLSDLAHLVSDVLSTAPRPLPAGLVTWKEIGTRLFFEYEAALGRTHNGG